MYGFNLGQIEGLDSSVQTVTLTIANQSESNTYTLNKANEDPLVWSDNLDFVSSTVYIMLTNGDAGLYVVAFTESDVGDTYNVTLSTSVVEENFKSGVEEAVGDRLLPEVTDADNGKVLTVVNGTWDKAEAGGGQSGGKSGIRVSLHVTDGTVENVYIDDEDATLGDLFDYGWENVSQIRISEGGNVISGTFLLQSIVNLPSGTRVEFGTLTLPGVISSTAGNGYIVYITIDSDGSYTKAYSGTIIITKY